MVTFVSAVAGLITFLFCATLLAGKPPISAWAITLSFGCLVNTIDFIFGKKAFNPLDAGTEFI